LAFSIKYRSKVLGVYIAEEKEKYEHLCYQFTDIEEFSEFYLTVSASDHHSKCSVDLYDLKLVSNFENYQIVANDQKKIEEPTLTYFSESENTKKHMEFQHFHTVYDLYRDNAKIFARELLTFADYNEKEVVSEMKTSIHKTEKAIDDAISIVELEARQIETLNNLLNSERRSVSNDVNETLDQILKWLQTMDTMFDKVDSETQSIHVVLSSLNFDEKLDNLAMKVKQVGENLAQAIGKTKLIVKPSKANELDDAQIDEWKSQLDNFQTTVTEKITIKGDEKLSKLQVLGFTILGIIGLAIMIAFLIMYCKIRIAMRNKRML
jgi:ribosomal protein S13